MGAAPLDRVLACTALPSLPAVAVEVLELTSDPDVRIRDLAEVVQNDQALATKILRTVNSSFYGLSRPCPTIGRALGYLGMSTVKSLVLGFSLVDCFRRSQTQRFDLIAYWRRAVYSAVGARHAAGQTHVCDPEEAFVAALLQDIGMLAMHIALGAEYDKAIESVAGDHERQAGAESDRIGLTHADAGAALAQSWRLPAAICAAIKHHHLPHRAPPEHIDLVRVVALARIAAAALTDDDPRANVSRLLSKGQEWFSLSSEQTVETLDRVAADAQQLSRLFSVNTGDPPDLMRILSRANEQMLQNQVAIEREATELRDSNTRLARQTITDSLTGAANRKHFDARLEQLIRDAVRAARPISLLFIDADRFKLVNDTYGHQAGDAVLVELTQRLASVVRSTDLVYRYGGEEFAIIVPNADAKLAAALGERLRRRVDETPFDLSDVDGPITNLRVTVSIGVASYHPASTADAADTPEHLVHAADQAVYAAKQAGRNRVRIHGDEEPAQDPAPPATASAAPAFHPAVLLVEDEFLTSKLISDAVERATGGRVTAVSTGVAALEALAGDPDQPSFDLVLLDLSLPGLCGTDLISQVRSLPSMRATPIVIITGSDAPDVRDRSLAAGANALIPKGQFCQDASRWAGLIMDMWAPARRAS